VIRYATFTRRFRALVVDVAIIMGVVAALVVLGTIAENLPGFGRVAWAVMFSAVFLYEPLFVWRRVATIGHARSQLTVVDARSGGHPALWQAFARYFAKGLLGIPSFVTMALTRKHQAVHDLLTKTTVQIRADVPLATGEFHRERGTEAAPGLPSKRRRSAIMVAYLFGLLVLYGALLTASDPQGCIRDQSCPTKIRLLTDAITIAWMMASLATIIAAWKGYLLGARSRRGPTAHSLAV
jgi:uncharacterized RDD family membrane protein YckC